MTLFEWAVELAVSCSNQLCYLLRYKYRPKRRMNMFLLPEGLGVYQRCAYICVKGKVT